MKKNIIKTVAAATLAVSLVGGLSGCVGSNAVTGKLMEVNVKAVDNRYARGGLNFLLSPVYALTIAADMIVINSIEFWSGKNPITGAPHIFDTKTDTMLNINDDMHDSLKDAPIAPITIPEAFNIVIRSPINMAEISITKIGLEVIIIDESIGVEKFKPFKKNI